MTRARALPGDRKEAAERFAHDTRDHKMTVQLDQGVYRHIRFSAPGSSNYAFWLTTFPGALVVSGDMGEWVFQRLPDMFEFFRSDGGRINPQYWAEKLSASKDGCATMSPLIVRKLIWNEALRVCRILKDNFFRADLRMQALEEYKQLRDRVVNYLPGSISQIHEFELDLYALNTPPEAWRRAPTDGRRRFAFEDGWWERCIHAYTFHFLWVCHAIVWGIQQYDAAKASASAQPTEVPA